jgi:hypothetical protein
MISLVLFHPHPASPVKGEEFPTRPPPSRGRSLASLPWWEGLREGDKMAFAFIWVIDPKLNIGSSFYSAMIVSATG